ncbi:hypothetical protein A2364_02905 [candidate division WWE3 bacterium RIFOXYB1_FULL_43_12]|nr:MAG: hypothetical protein A2364_02905 [candidate division WWE3 bacterium RIFOXYB1_FULL_43_12]
MKNLKILTVAASVSAFVLVGTLSAQNTYAFDFESIRPSSLIQRIMEKFNLNQDEVGEVITQYRKENQAERRLQIENRLNQYVSEGKITEEQKNLIIEKQKEWQALDPEDKRDNREEHRTEMQEWAKANGISEEFVFGGGPKSGMNNGGGYNGRARDGSRGSGLGNK